MSLATRCTACGTVFRVVQDQLKVSEGWVRCGRCQEVFNALEGLFDLDRNMSAAATASAWDEGATAPVPFDMGPHGSAWEADPADAAAAGASTQADTMSDSRSSSQPGSDASAAMSIDSEMAEDDDFADARFNTALLAADDAAAAADEQAALAIEQPPELPLDHEPAGAPTPPSFLTDAERAARWRRPGIRIAMMLGVAAMLVLLALQVSLQFHDAIAARWPAASAPMAALCEAAGCTIEPPRELGAVSVDSSGLVRAAEGTDAYRLSLVLRNHAEFAVAPPSVELSVTDSNGQLVARRVFAPADFGTAPPALSPLTETPLQLVLASSERISGYTIELFYP